MPILDYDTIYNNNIEKLICQGFLRIFFKIALDFFYLNAKKPDKNLPDFFKNAMFYLNSGFSATGDLPMNSNLPIIPSTNAFIVPAELEYALIYVGVFSK